MNNIIQRLGKAFSRKSKSDGTVSLENENQISIEEYNKAKEAFEKTKAEHESLIQSNNRITEETKSIINDIEILRKEIRTQKITNILSGLTMTDEERQKLLQKLVNGNLSIDDILETYESLMNKKNDINKAETTKLPQKSIPDHIR